MVINVGPAEEAEAVSEADASRRLNAAARTARAADRQRRAALLAAGFVALARLARDRRFQEGVLTLVIGIAAAAALARENQARSLARLVAWDQRQKVRQLRKVTKSHR